MHYTQGTYSYCYKQTQLLLYGRKWRSLPERRRITPVCTKLYPIVVNCAFKSLSDNLLTIVEKMLTLEDRSGRYPLPIYKHSGQHD